MNFTKFTWVIVIYRAIESAQSFVFGFYPSSNSTDIQRESVPIHTTGAGDQDPVIILLKIQTIYNFSDMTRYDITNQ